MRNLNKHLEEQLRNLPGQFLKRLVIDKLKEQGINNEALVIALTDYILSKSDMPFTFDDGENGPTKKLNLSFTEEDGEAISNSIRKFLKDSLPKVILDSVKDSAATMVKKFDKQWIETKIDDRNQQQYFKDRLDLRWSSGLDPLRMLLIASREIGEEFAEKTNRSKAKTGLLTRETMMLLHVRSCQTALEIITLLENGLADGAYARWRTLYEISVVALLVDRFGDIIAERYLAHDAVSMREAMLNEFKYSGVPFDPKALYGQQIDIEASYQSVVAEFGSSFASPYGWAATSLKLSKPTFQNLEEAVSWPALPPSYKSASYKIHAGASGTIRTLMSIGDRHGVHAGSTNGGLELPAIHTAYSLMHVTSLVFGKISNLENQIKMQSLVILRDRVVKQCQAAAKRLEKEELALQRNI